MDIRVGAMRNGSCRGKLVKQKKFSLVLKNNMEYTPLSMCLSVLGARIAIKTGYVSDIYTVLKDRQGILYCVTARETRRSESVPNETIIVAAMAGPEPIYPTLKAAGFCGNAPGSDLWHTLIEADNYHALQLLEYLYAEKVDCIC